MNHLLHAPHQLLILFFSLPFRLHSFFLLHFAAFLLIIYFIVRYLYIGLVHKCKTYEMYDLYWTTDLLTLTSIIQGSSLARGSSSSVTAFFWARYASPHHSPVSFSSVHKSSYRQNLSLRFCIGGRVCGHDPVWNRVATY